MNQTLLRRAVLGLAGLVVTSCLASLCAQDGPVPTSADGDPKAWARALFGDQPVAAEWARRKLCLADRSLVPESVLRSMLRHADADVVARAWSVLRAHGWDLADAAQGMGRAAPSVRALRLSVVPTETVKGALADPDASVRRAALFELEDRGALGVEHLAAILRAGSSADREASSGEEAADVATDEPGVDVQAALTLVFEERAEVDRLLLDAIVESRAARHLVLRSLASRPRANTVGWVRRLLPPAIARSDWLEVALLLGALPSSAIQRADAERLVRIAAKLDEPMDDAAGESAATAQRALSRLPSKHADALVGTAMAWLGRGLTLDLFLQCIGRATALGEAQCIPLLFSLDAEDVDRLCSWLESRSSTVFRAHLVDALDGKAPLAAYVLRRAGPLLAEGPQRAARAARLVALLNGPDPALDADADLAVLAFQALTAAGIYDESMLSFALVEDPVTTGRWSQPAQRVRALLQVPFERLPESLWNELFASPRQDVVAEVLRALRRGPPFAQWTGTSGGVLESKLAKALPTGTASDSLDPARFALLSAKGGRTTMEALFRTHSSRRAALVEALVQSQRPFSRALLLAWQAADSALVEPGWFARARLGEKAARDHVLALLEEPEPSVATRSLRRARDAMTRYLEPANRSSLVAILSRCESADVLQEVLGWLIDRPDVVGAGADAKPCLVALRHLAREANDLEVRDLAARALIRSGDVGERRRLCRAVRAGLDDDARDAVYALVDASPSPLPGDVVDALFHALLVAPLATPVVEVEASLEERVGRGEYPLQRVVLHRLMADLEQNPAARNGLLAAVRSACAGQQIAPVRRVAITRRRYGALTLAAHGDSDLELVTRPGLIEILSVAPPGLDGMRAEQFERTSAAEGSAILRRIPADGIGALLAARELFAAKEFNAAARAYQQAVRQLLRSPLPPLAERRLIGERSIVHRSQPRARLVARMWLCRATSASGSERAEALRQARAAAEGDADASLELARFRPANRGPSDKQNK